MIVVDTAAVVLGESELGAAHIILGEVGPKQIDKGGQDESREGEGGKLRRAERELTGLWPLVRSEGQEGKEDQVDRERAGDENESQNGEGQGDGEGTRGGSEESFEHEIDQGGGPKHSGGGKHRQELGAARGGERVPEGSEV